MKFRLLQLKDNKLDKYGFMSYDFAAKHGFDLADYEITYEMEVYSDHNLDDFFTMFNIERPADFFGRSMSVSDIIELDNIKYYCDRSCWKEI